MHASQQDGYANDLVIMMRRTPWEAMEGGLNQDVGTKPGSLPGQVVPTAQYWQDSISSLPSEQQGRKKGT